MRRDLFEGIIYPYCYKDELSMLFKMFVVVVASSHFVGRVEHAILGFLMNH